MTCVWLAIQDLMTSHACMPRTNLCFFSSPILAAHFNLDLSNPQIANIDLIIFNKFSCQKAALLQLPSSRERNHLSPFSDFLISLLPRDLHPHWTRLTLQLSYWFYRLFSNSFFLVLISFVLFVVALLQHLFPQAGMTIFLLKIFSL